MARLDSRILHIGSGCGRYAATLRDFEYYGTRFTGHYTGIDVAREMVEWCRAHFPDDWFTFELSGAYSRVYNPGGDPAKPPRYDIDDASQDFVFSNSLLTHLLEPELGGHLAEMHRVLAPGATALMTVFCMEHLGEALGGRWTFRHRVGEAHVENAEYPEATVAYSLKTRREACRVAGFVSIDVIAGRGQSLVRAG